MDAVVIISSSDEEGDAEFDRMMADMALSVAALSKSRTMKRLGGSNVPISLISSSPDLSVGCSFPTHDLMTPPTKSTNRTLKVAQTTGHKRPSKPSDINNVCLTSSSRTNWTTAKQRVSPVRDSPDENWRMKPAIELKKRPATTCKKPHQVIDLVVPQRSVLLSKADKSVDHVVSSASTSEMLKDRLETIRTKWQDLFDDNDDFDDKYVDENDENSNITEYLKTNDDFGREDADRFLSSLNVNVIDPKHQIHVKTKPYLTDFKRNRMQLVQHLFSLFNKYIFDDKLPNDLKITWNSRLTSTAGVCKCHHGADLTRVCTVELSGVLLKTADRVCGTLLHELCHAATWLLSKHYDEHGPFWRAWTRRARIIFPSLPPIERCHNYKK